jgi:CHASE2 domain-containing sensor protein
MSYDVPIDGKLVVLKFTGNFQQGFQVMLEIGSERDRPSIELVGALPPNPELALHLSQWRHLYRSLSVGDVSVHSRIHPQQIIYGGSVNRLEDCRQSARELQHLMRHWLESSSFRRLDQRLREALSSNESIRLLIRTQDLQLRRLPWHLWDFVERYSKTELALSSPVSERVEVEPCVAPDRKVKILAILGNSQDINVQADAQFLQALPNAMVSFLVEPSRQQINQQLWEQAWDILFFAGHSATEGDRGLIYINPHERLSLEELKYGLKQAIGRGLQLAIFNSCDGLGLAQALEPLHLPQMIVMREPVPDRVAQEFLKYLLAAFSGGKSLYLAVREARERLQGIEDQFPCATWLPVICQNSAKIPPTWQELANGVANQSTQPDEYADSDSYINQVPLATDARATEAIHARRNQTVLNYIQYLRRLIHWIRNGWFVILVSLVVTIGLTGAHYIGWLQSWELGIYDQMMQQRPNEGSDPRLLIVEIADADIEAQRQNGELLRRQSQSAQSFNQSLETSLSDQSLNRLLTVLARYQPRVIGLDIYRDFSVDPDQAELATRLRQTPGLISVCKAEDFDDQTIPSIDPPPEVPLDRVGFSDFREDHDGILRRHLLGMSPFLRNKVSRCDINRAFSVQVASQYLRQQNITAQFTANGDLQLDGQVFRILGSSHSSYPLLKAGGSEILLNYRSTEEIATRIKLQQILNDEIEISESLKDKIVLVGVTAQGGDDRWSTPLNPNVALPGVMVQAHMISQLLSAVLDQRPILTVLSQWQAIGWVWTWALMGGLLATWQWQRRNRRRSLIRITASMMLAVISLYASCFVSFLRGKWLPFVPSMLALIVSTSILVIYCLYRSQNRSTVSSL